MYKGKSVGVVIPAYNEELLIEKTLTTMPSFVDTMIVVNDGSQDKTREKIIACREKDPRILLIDHPKNQGLGQSLITGYLEARTLKIEIVAVMAGDAQMSPDDLERVIQPIAEDQFDYVKGNRLLNPTVFDRMPTHRFLGNSILTMLTKFATGYWHIIDPQCGYTAISHKALMGIPIETMIKGYGYNAHILFMLNLKNFRVCDVEVEPVYGEEKSKIKLCSYIPRVSCLLLKLFFKRISYKYFVREFHPLIFFYFLSLLNGIVIALPLSIRFLYKYFDQGYAPTTTLIILVHSISMAFFSLFFGMWLDMEDNRKLSKKHESSL